VFVIGEIQASLYLLKANTVAAAVFLRLRKIRILDDDTKSITLLRHRHMDEAGLRRADTMLEGVLDE
jgi:hypothetical protein